MKGEAAVSEARLWLGTPYVHRASLRGAGCDCLGLIRGIWRALYGAEPCVLPPYASDWAEAGAPEALLGAMQLHLRPKPLDQPALGDVLVFRMRESGAAKHLGLQSGPEHFIHAYSQHEVSESALSAPWARRLVARFQFP